MFFLLKPFIDFGFSSLASHVWTTLGIDYKFAPGQVSGIEFSIFLSSRPRFRFNFTSIVEFSFDILFITIQSHKTGGK